MGKPQEHYGKFRIRWTDETGTRRSETFDNCKDAEFEQRRRELEVLEIKRGLRSRIERRTFAELAEYWMEHRGKIKRSGKDDLSMLNRHLLPAFGSLQLNEITRARVDSYQKSKQGLNVKTIGNHLALLRAMLNVAKELNWLATPPKIQLPRYKALSQQFRFIQTREDIRRFLYCAKEHGDMAHCLYFLAIYTGLRAGEIAGLEWADINFETRLITVQRSYDGPTKSGQVRVVPIMDPLLPVLRDWRLKNPLHIAFPNQKGTMHGKSARVFQEIFQEALGKAQFKRKRTSRGTDRALTFHDLRHTFASHWMMNGGDIFKLQKILGHQSMAMTLRYAHLSPTAFSKDWSRMGDATELSQIVQLQRK